MEHTFDREKRREQRKILAEHFKDYSAVRHDAWVIEWNKEQDNKAFQAYLKNRKIQ